MRKFLEINKTNVGMVVLGILFMLRTYLPEHQQTIDAAIAIVGSFTGLAVRHAIAKAEMPPRP